MLYCLDSGECKIPNSKCNKKINSDNIKTIELHIKEQMNLPIYFAHLLSICEDKDYKNCKYRTYEQFSNFKEGDKFNFKDITLEIMRIDSNENKCENCYLGNSGKYKCSEFPISCIDTYTNKGYYFKKV